MPHLTLRPLPRDPWEPKDRHPGVESRLKQNRSRQYEEDMVITGRGSYQGRGSNRGGVCSKTTDATTATNQIIPKKIRLDAQQKESRVFFVIKLDISNVTVGESVEISENGEQ